MTEIQIARALAKVCADMNAIRDAARARPGMDDVAQAIGAALIELESAEQAIRKRRRDAKKPG